MMSPLSAPLILHSSVCRRLPYVGVRSALCRQVPSTAPRCAINVAARAHRERSSLVGLDKRSASTITLILSEGTNDAIFTIWLLLISPLCRLVVIECIKHSFISFLRLRRQRNVTSLKNSSITPSVRLYVDLSITTRASSNSPQINAHFPRLELSECVISPAVVLNLNW